MKQDLIKNKYMSKFVERIRTIHKELKLVERYSCPTTYFFKLEKISEILHTYFLTPRFESLREEGSIYKEPQVGSFQEALELFNKRFSQVVEIIFGFLVGDNVLENEEQSFVETHRELKLLLNAFPRKAYFLNK